MNEDVTVAMAVTVVIVQEVSNDDRVCTSSSLRPSSTFNPDLPGCITDDETFALCERLQSVV